MRLQANTVVGPLFAQTKKIDGNEEISNERDVNGNNKISYI